MSVLLKMHDTGQANVCKRTYSSDYYKSYKYRIDFWEEVKRRWMVLGVLVALAAAVLAPRTGAPGGKHACSLFILDSHMTALHFILPCNYIHAYFNLPLRFKDFAISSPLPH